MTPARRARGAGVWGVGVLVVTAVLAGIGTGGTLALWSAEERGTLRMPVGVTVFGVGAPATPGTLAQYATSEDDELVVTFGPAQAAALQGTGGTGGAVAVPVQVDALAQGHRGLTYTVTADVEGGVFGASRWSLHKVASAGACSTSTTGSSASTSTPVAATYSSSTALVTEYWCLVARYVPVTGTHTNTVTVGGEAVVPGTTARPQVTADDTWRSTARRTFDPAAEPTHSLTFAFSTFRPGAQP